MMFKLRLTIVTVLFGIVFLSGCATSRGVVELVTPITKETTLSNGKKVYINSVLDKRLFEYKPKQPNIPSLDPDEQQNNAIKLRAIARKRNTLGKGLGDILLKEGQTVESIIYDSLQQAFIENGYSIIENQQQVTSGTYIVDAKINKFWSWMNPGFWALTLSTEISTDISIKMTSEINKEIINVKVSDTFQTGAESNWVEVMQNALKAYITEVKLKLK